MTDQPAKIKFRYHPIISVAWHREHGYYYVVYRNDAGQYELRYAETDRKPKQLTRLHIPWRCFTADRNESLRAEEFLSIRDPKLGFLYVDRGESPIEYGAQQMLRLDPDHFILEVAVDNDDYVNLRRATFPQSRWKTEFLLQWHCWKTIFKHALRGVD